MKPKTLKKICIQAILSFSPLYQKALKPYVLPTELQDDIQKAEKEEELRKATYPTTPGAHGY